jgi:hypothetical protein
LVAGQPIHVQEFGQFFEEFLPVHTGVVGHEENPLLLFGHQTPNAVGGTGARRFGPVQDAIAIKENRVDVFANVGGRLLGGLPHSGYVP